MYVLNRWSPETCQITQSKYLTQTLVFMSNRQLHEKFNFSFSRDFI